MCPTGNHMIRKHHFTEMSTMVILNNTRKKKKKLMKKDIPKRNKTDVCLMGILN